MPELVPASSSSKSSSSQHALLHAFDVVQGAVGIYITAAGGGNTAGGYM